MLLHADHGESRYPDNFLKYQLRSSFGVAKDRLGHESHGCIFGISNSTHTVFSDSVAWHKGAHTASFGFSYYREQDHYYNSPAGFPFVTMGIDGNDPAAKVFSDYFASHFPNASNNDLTNAENMYATLVGRINSV